MISSLGLLRSSLGVFCCADFYGPAFGMSLGGLFRRVYDLEGLPPAAKVLGLKEARA